MANDKVDSEIWRSVIGHKDQMLRLQHIWERDTIPHALLLSGPSGVGKRRVAMAFASLLLQGKDPTAECFKRSAALLKAGNHPDMHLVFRQEDKKDISVEDVRNLCAKLHLKPYSSPARVAIIDNAHEMSIAASNAMLTTLEEPNPESYLILVSDAPQRLPATILSRCQTLPFGFLSPAELLLILDGLSASRELVSLCEGSLEPLRLDEFIHPVSLGIKNEEDLREHLANLVRESSRLRELVRNSLSASGPAQAIVLAGELAGKHNDSTLVWYLLRLELRKRLRAATASELSHWSLMMERALEAERLCEERNTNSQLQLSSLLLANVNAP